MAKNENHWKINFCYIFFLVFINIICIITFYLIYLIKKFNKLSNILITIFINLPIISQAIIYNNISIFYYSVYKRPTQTTFKSKCTLYYVWFIDFIIIIPPLILLFAADGIPLTIEKYLYSISIFLIIITIYVLIQFFIVIIIFLYWKSKMSNHQHRELKPKKFMKRSFIFLLLMGLLFFIQSIIIIISSINIDKNLSLKPYDNNNYNKTLIFFAGSNNKKINSITIIFYSIFQLISFCCGIFVIDILI